MSKQLVIALVSTIARLGLAVAAGWAVRQRGACQRHISVDFFFLFSFAPFAFPLATWSQGLPVHRHKSAFDTAMRDIPNPRDCPYLYRLLCQAQLLEWVSQQPLWRLLLAIRLLLSTALSRSSMIQAQLPY